MMPLAAGGPPWEGSMEQAGVAGAEPAVLEATELSKASWPLAVHDPSTGKASRHRVDGGDAAGLVGIVERYRQRARERTGGTVGAERVLEAGRDGSWLRRRSARAGIACRVRRASSWTAGRAGSGPTGSTRGACRGPGAGATSRPAPSCGCPGSRRGACAGRTASWRG